MGMLKLFFLLFYLLSCSTSPTGRKQLLLYSNRQLNDLGEKSFGDIKAKMKREKDQATINYVHCVAERLIKTQNKLGKWEVLVFKDESVNAFALPGGKIGIHTGLFKVAQTDAQLAAVIGHEIAHVLANHGNERVSQNVIAQIGMAGVNAYLHNKNQDAYSNKLIMAALGFGAQVGILLPYSRAHESEADILGLKLMAKAGFDPYESIKLWKNMEKTSQGKKQFSFLRTHPTNKQRISTLMSQMKQAQEIYKKIKVKARCQKTSLSKM
jgi:predicted Zn-dependent protease